MKRVLSSSFVFLLFSCANVPQTEAPDTIFVNGKIITVDSAFSIHEAIAISGGRIISVGKTDAISKKARAATKIIDLQGHTVIPGLIEGHAHPVTASQSEATESIPVVNSIAELLEWIRSEAKAKNDDEWIIHPKFFITRMKEMRQVSIRELDEAAPRNPVFLNGSYGAAVNSRAFQLSGISGSDHPGILRDEVSGLPTGLIRRSAFNLFATPQPDPLTEEEQLKLLETLLLQYNSAGITSVCSGGGSVGELALFRSLQRKGDLTVRIFHNVRLTLDRSSTEEEIFTTLMETGIKTGDGDEWVKVGALKIVLDGGMLTGTAFLHEGWGERAKELYGITDPEYRGELMYSKSDLVDVIRAAARNNWKFTAHVTGGGGVDTLLAAYKTVDADVPLKGKRFSIIHGNFFTPEAIKLMSEMGVYADIQPAWFFKDADLLHLVLGESRMETFHPYKSLVNAGIVVNGGSDHMVKVDPDLSINPYNPFTAMWSVVTRKTESGSVFNPEQGISREDALRMYTINNAYASFEEKQKGSIEAGKFADLVVLSADLLTCAKDSIRLIKPILTMVDGKIVYDAKELNTGAQKE